MRFLLVLVLATLAGISGWWTVSIRGLLQENKAELREKEEQIQRLGADLIESEEQRRQLEVSLHLLKVDHRVAKIEVLEQSTDPDNGEVVTKIRFQEMDGEGVAVDEGKVIDVQGRKVYLESLVIKFEDDYVEGGDFLRGSSVCLFKSVFGERQSPSEGVPVDAKGVHPHPYASSGDGEAEVYYQELWSQFWEYANDPELAANKGVRTMHGEAPFIETRPGKVYRVELRASGGLSIDPE